MLGSPPPASGLLTSDCPAANLIGLTVDYGFQHSRGFQALKAWMSLKEHGAGKYGQLIQQHIGRITPPGGVD